MLQLAGAAMADNTTTCDAAIGPAALLRDRQRCNLRRCYETGNTLRRAATTMADNAL
jgi:hypothetical protein